MLGERRAGLERLVEGWAWHDWQADPLSRGAYAHVLVGGVPAQRALVQTLDVGQFVLVAPGAGVDSPGGERPKHERIVGIRAVRHVDGPCRGRQESSLRFTNGLVLARQSMERGI